MRTTRMIQGGLALAAALAGAPVYQKSRIRGWEKPRSNENSLRAWRYYYDMGFADAEAYGVRADDARKVL